MGCKGMPEGMAAGRLADSGRLHCSPDGPPDHRRVEMMAPLLAGLAVPPTRDLRTHPLPAPLPRRIHVFPPQGPGQRHLPPTGGQILTVQSLDMMQMDQERFYQLLRQHGQPILVALASSDHDLVSGEIQILNP